LKLVEQLSKEIESMSKKQLKKKVIELAKEVERLTEILQKTPIVKTPFRGAEPDTTKVSTKEAALALIELVKSSK